MVLPGEFIANEEEFMPGFGVYSDEGVLFSSNIGELEMDTKRREAKVKVSTRVPMFFKRGSVVYGRVARISDNTAIIDVVPMKTGQFDFIPRPVTHILPISEVRRGYVKTMRDEFRLGDFVKAKILAIERHTVTLTTRASDLGVVKAFCTQCRHPLVLEKGKLVCKNCGNVERRKVSVEYGKTGGIMYEAEGFRREEK